MEIVLKWSADQSRSTTGNHVEYVTNERHLRSLDLLWGVLQVGLPYKGPREHPRALTGLQRRPRVHAPGNPIDILSP